MSASSVIAQTLKSQGIKYVFGIVGIPVTEVAFQLQSVGIKFIGMRNEQQASYAAGIIGYLTRKPGVCLTVSGPGYINAISGLANAHVNGWPMILMAGSCDRDQEGLGGFQEYPQAQSAALFSKYSCKPFDITSIPQHIEKCVRLSTYGRPGACYIDLSADVISSEAEENLICIPPECPDPPRVTAPEQLIKEMATTLISAEKPLVIIGKGAAYGRAENAVRELIHKFQLPFLPTPMGKGVVPDDSTYCVASARTKCLREADVILLLGARLNWILHFGRPPRFQKNVKFLQVDICPEELHNSQSAHVGIVGDVDSVTCQLLNELKERKYIYQSNTDWWLALRSNMDENYKKIEKMVMDKSVPLNYYAAFSVIQELIPKDAIIVNEGSNTMDIGRTMLKNILPRHRLDAATFGTMGIGVPFAIAAALWCEDNAPGKRVICIQGDSAFGFSGMEMETICRYKLPIIVIIFNNNGIYSGIDEESFKYILEEDTHLALTIPPTSYLPNLKYEKITNMFGGKGFYAETASDLQDAVKSALDSNQPCVINVAISPTSERKPQDFEWHTRSKL